MVKKLVVSLLALLTLSVLFITYAVISYAPSAPVFLLKNTIEQPVHVLAQWRDKSKSFQLTPKQETEFTVNDEASMDFVVLKTSGYKLPKRKNGDLGEMLIIIISPLRTR